MSETTAPPAGPDRPAPADARLPLFSLLALSTAVFITVITEALPAGLLPGMSEELGVAESAMGQAVTVYALGTALTVIPLSLLTAGLGRKPVLLTAMAGFVAANTVTALSSDYLLTMGARFIAGMAAGLSWALMVGYARRMAQPGKGKLLTLAAPDQQEAAGLEAGGAVNQRRPQGLAGEFLRIVQLRDQPLRALVESSAGVRLAVAGFEQNDRQRIDVGGFGSFGD